MKVAMLCATIAASAFVGITRYEIHMLRESRESLLMRYFELGRQVSKCHEDASELNLVLLKAYEANGTLCDKMEVGRDECLDALQWDRTWIKWVHDKGM